MPFLFPDFAFSPLMTSLPIRLMSAQAFAALTSTVVLGLCQPACALAQAASPASAASGPDASGDPVRVEITAVREPLEYPYERAYNAALKVQEASHGNTDLVISIIEEHPAGTPLRVSLQYGETVEMLEVDRSNAFRLTPNRKALDDNAILVTNRRRAGLSVQAGLRPHVEAGATLTRADINRLVEGGQAARKSLLPWYARIVVPTVSGVRLCSLTAGASFALRGAGGADQVLATKDDKDLYDRPAHCVDLDVTDDAQEASMSVVMPPDATVDYAASAF